MPHRLLTWVFTGHTGGYWDGPHHLLTWVFTGGTGMDPPANVSLYWGYWVVLGHAQLPADAGEPL